MNDLKILIVGGGNIASEKLSHLLNFTKNIDVIAPELNDSMRSMIENNKLSFENRKYQKGDIESYKIVITAVDDKEAQKDIFEETRGKDILCNSVDVVEYCDFIFPSYVKKGDLTVAVSTSGASPAGAKYIRRFIEDMIPDSVVDFLKQMKELRKTMPKGKERMEFLDKKAKEYINSIR